MPIAHVCTRTRPDWRRDAMVERFQFGVPWCRTGAEVPLRPTAKPVLCFAPANLT
jgi:hypothetical protein